MRLTNLATPAAVVIAVALLAAGCGGGEDTSAPPAVPTTQAPPGDAPPPPESGGAEPPADGDVAAQPPESPPGEDDTAQPTEPPAGEGTAPPPADPPPPPTTAATPPAPQPEASQTPPHVARMPWGTFNLAERIAGRLEAGAPLNLVLSVADAGSPDAESLRAGWSLAAGDVAADHGVAVNARTVGPPGSDIAAQLAEIQALIDAGEVDCLAFQASEPQPYVDVINDAVQAGIPVFGVGGDSPRSLRFAFYGLEDLAAGEFAGRVVGEWATTRRILIRKAGVLTADAEEGWAQDRMRGFIDGLTEFLPDIDFVNGPRFDITSQGFDPEEAYAASEAWIAEHPDVDVIFHTDAGVEAVARVIGTNLLYGDVYTVGFGMSHLLGLYIQEGVVIAAMVEGLAAQAALGAQACGDFLLAGDLDTGHVVLDPIAVTRDNVLEIDWTLPGNL